MLEVSHISRSYGRFRAVDDVSFRIGQGEIVGLLGHNGAGKTTIMKMLSGYIETDDGSIRVDGIDMASDAKAIQRNLGYLPESPPVYPEMTVAEYLDYVGELKGLEGAAREAEIRRCIGVTDLADRFDQRIHTLSRGYRQRVGVAQALLGSPRLLILDEPTNGLDPAQTEQMRDVIRRVADEATVILSTHIMQEVEAVCDRVLLVHQGRLAVDERLDRLTASNVLIVESTAGLETVRAALGKVAGIGRIESAEPVAAETSRYRITLEAEDATSSTGAAIAAALVGAGAGLSALYPERRDLETLFAEVTLGTTGARQTEVDHAA